MDSPADLVMEEIEETAIATAPHLSKSHVSLKGPSG